jgi:transketolase
MDRATELCEGTEVLLVACGEMVKPIQEAAALLHARGISTGALDMYCVKPLDREGLLKAAKGKKLVVSVEEHSPFGGLGSMVAQVISAEDPKRVINLALPDAPVITGTSAEVFRHYGLTGEGIAETVRKALEG